MPDASGTYDEDDVDASDVPELAPGEAVSEMFMGSCGGRI